VISKDRKAFFSALEAVFGVYGKNPSETAASLYFDVLSKYELQDILRALSAHVQNPDNGQYLPKPADLIKILDGDSQTAALKAWTKVVDAIKKVGPYQDVVFDDPLVHLVITEMGGWIHINGTLTDELPFRSNEFVKRYQGSSRSFGNSEYPKILTGISNAGNQLKGHDACKPVLIGCPDKARLVYKGGSLNSGSRVTRFLSDDAVKKIENGARGTQIAVEKDYEN
jgi:hypothetical protein